MGPTTQCNFCRITSQPGLIQLMYLLGVRRRFLRYCTVTYSSVIRRNRNQEPKAPFFDPKRNLANRRTTYSILQYKYRPKRSPFKIKHMYVTTAQALVCTGAAATVLYSNTVATQGKNQVMDMCRTTLSSTTILTSYSWIPPLTQHKTSL